MTCCEPLSSRCRTSICFVLHQATQKMLEQLRERLGLSEDRMPIILRDVGNTVSSTIPIMIDDLRAAGSIVPGAKNLLVGFGVGWSWAGCIWRDTWQMRVPGLGS